MADGGLRGLLAEVERANAERERIAAGLPLPRDRRHASLAPEAKEAQSADYSRQSIARSQTRIARALAIPCDEHDAHAGVHCWGGTSRGGTRGLCQPRFAAALALLADPTHSALVRGGSRGAR